MALRTPHLVVPALLATALATACSSKSPPPQAFVTAQATTGASGMCNYSSVQSLLLIGSAGDAGLNSNPVRVPTGTNEGGAVSITCSVAPSNGSFNIELSAELDTSLSTGGSLTITGTVDSTTGGSNIAGTFVHAGNTYVEEQNDCTITYPADPPGGPVAPGRIWGQISCPNATLEGQNANGTMTTCAITALFVFENCSG